MLQSGDIAPAFSLPDADMEMFDLASVVGKQNVVLYFYPRDKTPGVRPLTSATMKTSLPVTTASWSA